MLREDSVRRSMQPPYSGPHRVVSIAENGKTWSIEVKGKQVTVSVDRIKPAFVENSLADLVPAQAPQVSVLQTAQPDATDVPSCPLVPSAPLIATPTHTPQYTTRSGRRVHFSKPFDL